MLLRNLDADADLCNGVRAVVIRPLPRALDVLLISGSNAGTRVYIPRLVLAPKNPDLPFVLRRRQLPVKLAWRMTVNKAQGQTLVRVAIYLFTQVFSHGQLYVGLSRAGSSKDVKVLVEETDAQGRYDQQDDIDEGVYTDNVVWPEALLQQAKATIADSRIASSQGKLANNSTINGSNNEEVVLDEGFVLDECTGIPVTPRAESPEQPVDLHGTDDVDEFGAVAPENAESVVSFVAETIRLKTTIGAKQDSEKSIIDDNADAGQTMDGNALDALQEIAAAHGVTYSEWYELAKKSIAEIHVFLDALATPTSAGASSSA